MDNFIAFFTVENIAIVLGIAAAAVAVFKGVAKFTKTTKDDAVAEKLEDIVEQAQGYVTPKDGDSE